MTAVYVAGSSREVERVRRAMWSCRAAGMTITHDWLAEIESAVAANEGLSEQDRVKHSRADIDRGIGMADVVWLLLPEQPTIGAWVEFGYALCVADHESLHVITSGAGRERTIFTALASGHFDSDAAAIDAIAAWSAL